MLSDIAQSQRAQQGVHNGVGEHVGVGVAQKTLFIRDIHPAQNEPTFLRQLMYVVAVADPHGASSRKIASATARSMGVVILILRSSPGVRGTVAPSRSTAEESSVTSQPSSIAF